MNIGRIVVDVIKINVNEFLFGLILVVIVKLVEVVECGNCY